jgi:hypothetical protein
MRAEFYEVITQLHVTPGNANLPIGVLQIANREIGVPRKGEAIEFVFLLKFPIGRGHIRSINIGDSLRATVAHHQF